MCSLFVLSASTCAGTVGCQSSPGVVDVILNEEGDGSPG